MDPTTHPEQVLALTTDGWWACQQPERPYDDGTAYGDKCRPCLLHATVALAQGHGRDVGILREPGSIRLGTLADYVAENTADITSHDR